MCIKNFLLSTCCTCYSVVLLSSWVLMLTDVVTLLCTLVQYSAQLFLTSVTKEKHLHSLFKLLTITNEYSTDQIGNLESAWLYYIVCVCVHTHVYVCTCVYTCVVPSVYVCMCMYVYLTCYVYSL